MIRIEASWRAAADGPDRADPRARPGADPRSEPVARLADHAVALWHTAVELDDAALLDALRPLMMRVGRILAREALEQAVPDQELDASPQ